MSRVLSVLVLCLSAWSAFAIVNPPNMTTDGSSCECIQRENMNVLVFVRTGSVFPMTHFWPDAIVGIQTALNQTRVNSTVIAVPDSDPSLLISTLTRVGDSISPDAIIIGLSPVDGTTAYRHNLTSQLTRLLITQPGLYMSTIGDSAERVVGGTLQYFGVTRASRIDRVARFGCARNLNTSRVIVSGASSDDDLAIVGKVCAAAWTGKSKFSMASLSGFSTEQMPLIAGDIVLLLDPVDPDIAEITAQIKIARANNVPNVTVSVGWLDSVAGAQLDAGIIDSAAASQGFLAGMLAVHLTVNYLTTNVPFIPSVEGNMALYLEKPLGLDSDNTWPLGPKMRSARDWKRAISAAAIGARTGDYGAFRVFFGLPYGVSDTLSWQASQALAMVADAFGGTAKTMTYYTPSQRSVIDQASAYGTQCSPPLHCDAALMTFQSSQLPMVNSALIDAAANPDTSVVASEYYATTYPTVTAAANLYVDTSLLSRGTVIGNMLVDYFLALSANFTAMCPQPILVFVESTSSSNYFTQQTHGDQYMNALIKSAGLNLTRLFVIGPVNDADGTYSNMYNAIVKAVPANPGGWQCLAGFVAFNNWADISVMILKRVLVLQNNWPTAIVPLIVASGISTSVQDAITADQAQSVVALNMAMHVATLVSMLVQRQTGEAPTYPDLMLAVVPTQQTDIAWMDAQAVQDCFSLCAAPIIVTVTEKHFDFSTQLLAAEYTTFAVSVVVQIGLVAFLIVKRKTDIVRASSYRLMILLVLGLMVVNASAILFIQLPTPAICHARQWVLPLSLVFTLAVLFVKSRRISLIFLSGSLRVHSYSDSVMLAYAAAICSAMAVIIGILQGSGIGFVGADVSESLTIFSQTEHTRTFTPVCTADSLFLLVTALFVGVLLIAVFSTAWSLRNVNVLFHEPMSIIIVAFLSLAGFFVLVIQLIIEDRTETTAILRVFPLSILSLFVSLTLVGQKIWAFAVGYTNKKDKKGIEEQKQEMQGSNSSDKVSGGAHSDINGLKASPGGRPSSSIPSGGQKKKKDSLVTNKANLIDGSPRKHFHPSSDTMSRTSSVQNIKRGSSTVPDKQQVEMTPTIQEVPKPTTTSPVVKETQTNGVSEVHAIQDVKEPEQQSQVEQVALADISVAVDVTPVQSGNDPTPLVRSSCVCVCI